MAMVHWARVLTSFLAVLLLAGCAPRPSESGDNVAAPPPLTAAPKRITVGVQSDFTAVATRLVRSGTASRPGVTEVESLVHAGLSQTDNTGALQGELAEAVPSTANGLWKVFPDGRMETTWRIREGAVWQDGTPFTSDDLLFTATVGRDPELPLMRNSGLALVERMTAPDPRTLVVEWKQPFIDADTLFAANGSVQHLPLPKHLLESTYLDNKSAFETLPYWSTEFVGLGPYRVQDWTFGSFLILQAYDQFVLGRPKIDSIEVRFYPDPNVLQAAMLSEAVDLPLGTSRSTSYDLAQDLQARWSGTVTFSPGNALAFWPQLLNPTPTILGDARFRRALVQAVNRQEMVNAFYSGNTTIADAIIGPQEPEYVDVKASAVRYDYDPRQATAAIEALGFSKGPDGIFRDAAGQPLELQIHSGPTDLLQKAKLAAASQWQTLGIAMTPINDSDAQRADVRYRAAMMGFDTARVGTGIPYRNFKSTEARTPENGYVGLNTTGYMSPELDSLIDRYLVTIPRPERVQVAGQIVHHLSDQVVPMLMFYDVTATAVGRRVRNVATEGNELWNAIAWDVN
jgi:peptide/nickel transport system substrate-binding protein